MWRITWRRRSRLTPLEFQTCVPLQNQMLCPPVRSYPESHSQSALCCKRARDFNPLTTSLVAGPVAAVGGDVAPHQQQRRTPSPARRVTVSPPKGGLHDKDVQKYLMCGGVSNIIAINMNSLVSVVPRNGPGDKAKEYCINGFAIENYSALLAERQRMFPKWYRHSLFAKTTKLIRATHYTFRVDLRRRCMCVYDSLPPSKVKDKHERKLCIDRAKVVVALAVMKTDIYTDALMWDLIHVECPQQDKFVPRLQLHILYAIGHDYGVFVMIFMDVLALAGQMMCFKQSDIRTLRDKTSLIGVPVCHAVNFQYMCVDYVVCHGGRRVGLWNTLPALCPTREAWTKV
ncbi:hypothetical protein Cgig2_006580 [Carnegiea gigantea]|uniref:Uncharacterized protein n=1 Tax=Carnegiea gigantea TaxID=171969 RepID=A0A9Q1QLQ5_9CARY|nr:hypothetical protein Cgig2_006580 [Carnegiea gigantea]